jgi:hypothetical protein
MPPPEGSRGHRHPILTLILRPLFDRTFTTVALASIAGRGRDPQPERKARLLQLRPHHLASVRER